jgi:hypothetical protein
MRSVAYRFQVGGVPTTWGWRKAEELLPQPGLTANAGAGVSAPSKES